MQVTASSNPYRKSWILLLAVLTAIAPLSTDMYLPALPDMAQDFNVSTILAANSLPAYFLGLAIGQLIYGPISDRIGRKIPLIFGLSLHIIASILCIYADSLSTLLIVRVLQALGSCVGLVLARAAIRDVLDTASAAKAFASMMIVMGIAPVIAPTLGAWLLIFFPWQSIFVALTALGIVSLIWVLLQFKETLPAERRLKLSFMQAGQLYVHIAQDRSYIYPMLAGCFSFGILFCYINAASAVLMDQYHFSQQQFAYVFGLNAVGTVLLSSMNHKLEKKHSVAQRLKMGGAVQAFGVVILLLAFIFSAFELPLMLVGLFLAVAGIGLTAPNSTALAMSQQGRQAGSASALMGSLQFGFGLLSGVLLNVLLWTAQINMTLSMLFFVVCANAAIFMTQRYLKSQLLFAK
ncbi:multidrug effflux MFS transporter [Acinetobacter sp. ANC 3813]|uniref:multidrug effflux MFS transporter n=1 Tax=Acinetobacter sp. ANC 3813 TaxID=1977873 RepID=UPI000A34A200|nr:multidrug effflux MFS transporter [Acinetobacter sp. ANC 3813]OTG90898.1 Bcr/CflA family drug resistance efflux transporter [Acinetobacter sp. ANC 3813]